MEKSFVHASHTEVGTENKENQDYLGYFSHNLGEIFIVCNGTGNEGAFAARVAVDHLREFLESKNFEAPKEALKQAILYANQKLHEALQKNESESYTTCLLVLVTPHQAFFAQVGYAMLYTLAGKEFIQHTTDQPSDRGLGKASVVPVEVSEHINLHKGNKMLISTSGFHFIQNDVKALLATKENDPSITVNKIIDKAKKTTTEHPYFGLKFITDDDVTLHLLDFQNFKGKKKPNRVLKILKNWSFPIILLSALGIIFGMQHFREKGIEGDEKQRFDDSVAIVKRNKIINDSLSLVDAKADTFLIHRIQPGESLGSIGSKYNISMDSLADWNGIENKSRIKKNMKIQVKIKMLYIIEKERTLEDLYEEKFVRWKEKGVTIKSIKRANSYQKLDGILPKGTKIIIPNLRRLYI